MGLLLPDLLRVGCLVSRGGFGDFLFSVRSEIQYIILTLKQWTVPMFRRTVISTCFMVVEIADRENFRNFEISTCRYLGALFSYYLYLFVERWVCRNRGTSKKQDGPSLVFRIVELMDWIGCLARWFDR